MTTSFNGGKYRSFKASASPSTVIQTVDSGSDHLAGVKKQLRRNYSEALEISLPDKLASLISQLDKAP